MAGKVSKTNTTSRMKNRPIPLLVADPRVAVEMSSKGEISELRTFSDHDLLILIYERLDNVITNFNALSQSHVDLTNRVSKLEGYLEEHKISTPGRVITAEGPKAREWDVTGEEWRAEKSQRKNAYLSTIRWSAIVGAVSGLIGSGILHTVLTNLK